jgi:hypothetical protein
MVYALSNLILLFPIACGLAIVLAMTGGLTKRARPDAIRTCVRLLVWQLIILSLIGLTFRMTVLHVFWGIIVVGFAIHMLFWEYGLARNTVMLVWLAAQEVPENLNSVVNYLKAEGRGYWKKLGIRLSTELQSSGDWLMAGKRAGLMRDARTHIAMEVARHCNHKELMQEELIAATEQKLLFSQLLGRLVAASLSLLPLMMVGSFFDARVGPLMLTLQEMETEFDRSSYLQGWLEFSEWRMYIWIPLAVWCSLAGLYGLSFFPALTRYPPLSWFCRGYYKALTLRCLAEFVRCEPRLSVACRGAATAVPMPGWSSRLIDAAMRLDSGAPLQAALSRAGLARSKEAEALALCANTASLPWALEELAASSLWRTFNRLSVLVQVLVVCIVLVSGMFVAFISLVVYSSMAAWITTLA